MLEGRDVDLTLAEEKRQLQHLNVGLAEKVAVMREAEANVVAKMHDFRYFCNGIFSRQKQFLIKFRNTFALESTYRAERTNFTYSALLKSSVNVTGTRQSYWSSGSWSWRRRGTS